MIRWTSLAPWKVELRFSGSLTSTSLEQIGYLRGELEVATGDAGRLQATLQDAVFSSPSSLLSSPELRDTTI